MLEPFAPTRDEFQMRTSKSLEDGEMPEGEDPESLEIQDCRQRARAARRCSAGG